jgi:hypothetical protein
MKKMVVFIGFYVLFSCAVKKKQTEVVKNTESFVLKENATAVNKKSDLFSNSTDFITDYSFVTKKIYRLIDPTKPGSVTDAAGKTYNLDNAEIVEETEQKNKQQSKTKTERSSQTTVLKTWNNEAVIFKVEDVTSATEVERPKAFFSWWYLLLGLVLLGVGYLCHKFIFR